MLHGHYNYSLHAFQHSSELLKSQFAQIIGKLTIIINNVDSKSKCGWLMKNIKSPNSGLGPYVAKSNNLIHSLVILLGYCTSVLLRSTIVDLFTNTVTYG